MVDFETVTNTSINYLEQFPYEIESVRDSIYAMAEKYNVLGISKPGGVGIIEGQDGGEAIITRVGGSVKELEVGGESIYFNGADPYVLPTIDEEGNVSFVSPEFYRWIGHHVNPVANHVDSYHPQVADVVEAETGQSFPHLDTGHHGVGQCRIGEVVQNGDWMEYRVVHQSDKTNPYEFVEVQRSRFGENGEYIEEIELQNPNNFPIPVSLLRHPYFRVPAETAEDAIIYTVDSEGKRQELYSLRQYRELEEAGSSGEARFALPNINKGEYIEFDRGDGTIIQIGFSGDYDFDGNAGLQIFSNGFTESKILDDFDQKFELHKQKLKQAQRLYEKLGIEVQIFDESRLEDEREYWLEELKKSRSICIEDNTSRGNIYAEVTEDDESPNGIETAVWLEPIDLEDESRNKRKYRRITRVIKK